MAIVIAGSIYYYFHKVTEKKLKEGK